MRVDENNWGKNVEWIKVLLDKNLPIGKNWYFMKNESNLQVDKIQNKKNLQ